MVIPHWLLGSACAGDRLTCGFRECRVHTVGAAKGLGSVGYTDGIGQIPCDPDVWPWMDGARKAVALLV